MQRRFEQDIIDNTSNQYDVILSILWMVYQKWSFN